MAIVRRNLLIMLAQGLRSDALSDANVWPLATHRIDQMQARGMRFVATAASPVCGASITSLLTGLHARQHGLLHDAAPPTLDDALPARLRAEGYFVLGVGCVRPIAGLCDRVIGVEDVAQPEPVGCAYMDAAAGKGLAGALRDQRRQRLRAGPFDPDRVLLEPDDDIDGFIAAAAARALEALPDDRPWAAIVAFSGPANQLPPPVLYDQLVQRDQLRGNFAPPDMTRLDDLAEPEFPRAVLQRLEPASIAQLRADYLGRVALVDHGVGLLRSAVSRRMDRDRTWFMLGSDRGVMLGERGIVGHCCFLGPAVETPMIVAPPLPARAPEEQHVDALLSTVDFAATAAAIAAVDAHPEATGRSILPAFTGDAFDAHPRGGLVSEFGDRVMLETEQYRIVFDRHHARMLSLFDLLNDPHEKRDLVGEPATHKLAEKLRVRLGTALLPLRSAGVIANRA